MFANIVILCALVLPTAWAATLNCPSLSYVPKTGWKAASAKQSTQTLTLPVSAVVVHTTSPTCNSRETCSVVMRNIQCNHKTVNNFHDIAYHFAIGPGGHVFEGRGWFQRAALETGRNQNALSIAYLGQASPNGAMTSALSSLIACGISNNYIAQGVAQESGSYDTFGQCATEAVTDPPTEPPTPARPVRPVRPVRPTYPTYEDYYDYNESGVDYYDYSARPQPRPQPRPRPRPGRRVAVPCGPGVSRLPNGRRRQCYTYY